jgi:protein arginine N-methyltransferase 1
MTAISELVVEKRPAAQAPASGFAVNMRGRRVPALINPARDFPAWHFAMLNDQDRNRALERAISKLDLQGKVVFEVGTGCGLIALLFAKYGAKHVYTCEANSHLADIAARVISNTGLSERITLYCANSSTLIEESLLPEQPEVIFTETLDCGVVGEGFYAVARDIRRIARPDTLIMPGLIQQYGILVEAPALAKLNRVDEACGFDVSALNIFSTRNYFPVRERLYDYTPLSEPFLLHEYTYAEERPTISANALAYRSGTADGVLSWFEAQFGDETITNSPGTHGHWHQAFHPFNAPLEADAKQEIALRIDNHGHIAPQVPEETRA